MAAVLDIRDFLVEWHKYFLSEMPARNATNPWA